LKFKKGIQWQSGEKVTLVGLLKNDQTPPMWITGTGSIHSYTYILSLFLSFSNLSLFLIQQKNKRTEKNCFPWADNYLRTSLKDLSAEGNGFKANVSEISTLEGETTVGNRKGKVYFIYELNMTLKWKGKIEISKILSIQLISFHFISLNKKKLYVKVIVILPLQKVKLQFQILPRMMKLMNIRLFSFFKLYFLNYISNSNFKKKINYNCFLFLVLRYLCGWNSRYQTN